MIQDSDDLKSRERFRPYLDQLPWQTRRRYESWLDGIRAIAVLRTLQSIRAPCRSICLEPQHSSFLGLESFSLYYLFPAEPSRRIAGFGRLFQLSAHQALPHRDSRQHIPLGLGQEFTFHEISTYSMRRLSRFLLGFFLNRIEPSNIHSTAVFVHSRPETHTTISYLRAAGVRFSNDTGNLFTLPGHCQ